MKSPYPYFGGKSRAAPLVWERFGDVKNYVEPFFGSGAVLLARPHEPHVETVNDVNAFIANFWRALQHDPDSVAHYADWPVSEPDLHARHRWLVTHGAERVERLMTDPDYYDAKVAGWWVWGICQWIGTGWCDTPHVRKLPHVGDAGRGVHAPRHITTHQKRPHLMSNKGIFAARISRQLPHVAGGGRGVHRPAATEGLYEYMHALARRLRRVRVCCGDWTRVLGPSVTERIGMTGIFLDPPYGATDRDTDVYGTHDDLQVAHAVREWAIANGDNPRLRIALCGYEEEHADHMPETWECVAWKAGGGYGNQNGSGNDNGTRERIWFSPACLRPAENRSLFAWAEGAA